MGIYYHQKTKEFHLCNDSVSYIIKVLKNGQMGQLYFGSRIPDKEDFGYFVETVHRPMSPCLFEGDSTYSLEHLKQEYPSYGTTDYREPAFEILQENGSRISDFVYKSHTIYDGKPELQGLPAIYTEDTKEAQTLEILLEDSVMGAQIVLYYTIMRDYPAITRSVKIRNYRDSHLRLTKAMSLCLDLPDRDYEWMQLSGAWARERHIKTRKLQQGIQAIGSIRGNSSHHHNPFVALKRSSADERQGEVIAMSLIYSGNFIIQGEVDTYDVTRMLMGIHPTGFTWDLPAGEEFQTPEAVLVYSENGLNGMSQTFHKLFRTRLARGYWRDRERPVLINNWEATYFDFTEESLLEIAKTAQKAGVELFVLDDGWFGTRNDDKQGLGDWFANKEKLKEGISGLSRRIEEECQMKFGLWFEPEMVNENSQFYRSHPDYRLEAPGRRASHGRNQHVLDFSRKEVVDSIYQQMEEVLKDAKVSYIKWDMNRSITECFSRGWPADQQGEIFHRYILGVYDLYERLRKRFPEILFESCASGGGRFDPGMMYYAPQAWTSDDTDAVERLKIQYGTSMAYPLSSMGAHISAVPNHQVFRNTPFETRANVAYFGAFGYELDMNQLSEEEQEEMRRQVAFVKKYRKLIHQGTFYRLLSPFEGNIAAWMVVSEDKKDAVIGYYKILNDVNAPYRRVKLQGLDAEGNYAIEGRDGLYSGKELMRAGMITSDPSAGQGEEGEPVCSDFWSQIFLLHRV
ncbi:alpha-galactosidase [Blautia sp. An249]|uniref:alpha-galactosidase n=1 Tax=Blautia sp. An249 TaxID=1965603 RepID=UPI000B38F6F0|nr:alpha-galactosidase [Blautia sp. An249]OUO80742.1 alpha-galactosidase [Blautia sp. An249]